MTDKKFTDEEIIKALELCHQQNGSIPCYDCPCWDDDEQKCEGIDYTATLDLINRQKAEIEELKDYINRCKSGEEYWVKCLLEKPNEAVKEFVEKLKNSNEFYDSIRAIGNIDKMDCVVNCIDNILKEMVGEEE